MMLMCNWIFSDLHHLSRFSIGVGLKWCCALEPYKVLIMLPPFISLSQLTCLFLHQPPQDDRNSCNGCLPITDETMMHSPSSQEQLRCMATQHRSRGDGQRPITEAVALYGGSSQKKWQWMTAQHRSDGRRLITEAVPMDSSSSQKSRHSRSNGTGQQEQRRKAIIAASKQQLSIIFGVLWQLCYVAVPEICSDHEQFTF